MEDALNIYFGGKTELFFKNPLKCKDHDYFANTLGGVAIHLRKDHHIIIARGDTKRRIYHQKDILPGSRFEDALNRRI